MKVDWKKIPFFEGLEDSEIDLLRPVFREVSVHSGINIISEGELGDDMFILVSGQVRISKAMLIKGMSVPLTEMKNPRKVLATLDDTGFPIFGEIALIDRDERSATVTVIEDSDFLVTDRDRFFRFVEANPVAGGKLLMRIGRRLAATVRRSNSELVKLTTALALALSHSRTAGRF